MQDRAREFAVQAVDLAVQGQWAASLAAARACRQAAPRGTTYHVWAAHQLACTYVDAGRTQMARTWAKIYLREAHGNPGMARFTAFVVRVLGLAAYHERSFREASAHFRSAITLFREIGDTEQVDRTRLSLVWSLIRAGRPAAARESLAQIQSVGHLRDGAEAAVLAAEGRYSEAVNVGRRALDASRLSHDYVDAAEVCWVVAQALRSLGDHALAHALTEHAAQFMRRQAQGMDALLVLNQARGGGDLSYAAVVSRGSCDPLDGASLTSGVG